MCCVETAAFVFAKKQAFLFILLQPFYFFIKHFSVHLVYVMGLGVSVCVRVCV